MSAPVSRFPLVQLRNVSAIPITNGLGEAGNPANDEAWPRYIRTTDIAAVRALDANKRVTLPQEVARLAPVLRGDILMTSAGATVGKSYLHQTDEAACFAGYLSRLRVRPDRALPEFVAYWTESPHYLDQVQSGAVKSTIENFSAAKYRAMWMPLPPLEEQRAIADYLDRETAQIDAFIAKNEELITLLTERRSATIGLAVTRGIRRDVPFRSTEVPWLGDVPAHWSVAGLARYASTISGAGFPEHEQGIEDLEIAFYKVNALGQADADGVIRKSWDTISRHTAQNLRAKILPPGTILLAKIGAALLLGRIRRTDRLACIDNNMMAIVPRDDLDVRFASYALQTFDFTTLANPGTVPSMDMYALMHRETAIPPIPEQVEIADYLDRRLSELDSAIETCRRGIDLARERRAALISAAVTGKIDVGVAV